MTEQTALYRLFAADGTLLYVGIAKRFGHRWGEHAKMQPWWPHVDHQTVQWLPSREEAALVEKQAIKDERPVYNIAGSPWQGGLRDDGTGFFVIPKPPREGPGPGGRPKTGQTPVHNVRIENEIWQDAQEVASDEGRTMTDVIKAYLKRYGSPARKRREAAQSAPPAS